MNLKRPDLCTIIPPDAQPPGWPDGWLFPPGPIPPGWPRPQTEAMKSVAITFDFATLYCKNEYGERDHSLDGQLVCVEASTPDRMIRVAIDKSKFGHALLLQINDGRVDLSALRIEDKFANGAPITVKASLYGYEREPLTWPTAT